MGQDSEGSLVYNEDVCVSIHFYSKSNIWCDLKKYVRLLWEF